MTTQHASDAYDINIPDGVETRFGIRFLEYNEADSTVAMSMPLARMTNPLTQRSTLAPLALLVDDIGTTVGFSCRRGRWPVSGELTMAVSPNALNELAGGDGTVVAHGGLVGKPCATDALARCEIRAGESTIASAFLHTVYVAGDAVVPDRPHETLTKTDKTTLADLLAVCGREPEGDEFVLGQMSDPMIWNATEHVHGGISATALELVAHGAIANARPNNMFRTGSLRVNFLRPLTPGDTCRYAGRVNKVGSRVALADARAIGADGKVAVVAQLTAYADSRD